MPENPSNRISTVIQTLHDILDLFKSYQDVDCLPDPFQTVISVAMEKCDLGACALDTVRHQADEQASFDSSPALDDCQNKARRIRQLLSSCFEGDPACIYSRYVSQIRRLGKQERIETLVLGILHGIQDLPALRHGVAATGQRQKLKEAVAELSVVGPSVSDDKLDAPSYQSEHYGSGTQSIHTGSGHQGINSGAGEMYVGTNQTFNHSAGKDL